MERNTAEHVDHGRVDPLLGDVRTLHRAIRLAPRSIVPVALLLVGRVAAAADAPRESAINSKALLHVMDRVIARPQNVLDAIEQLHVDECLMLSRHNLILEPQLPGIERIFEHPLDRFVVERSACRRPIIVFLFVGIEQFFHRPVRPCWLCREALAIGPSCQFGRAPLAGGVELEHPLHDWCARGINRLVRRSLVQVPDGSSVRTFARPDKLPIDVSDTLRRAARLDRRDSSVNVPMEGARTVSLVLHLHEPHVHAGGDEVVNDGSVMLVSAQPIQAQGDDAVGTVVIEPGCLVDNLLSDSPFQIRHVRLTDAKSSRSDLGPVIVYYPVLE